MLSPVVGIPRVETSAMNLILVKVLMLLDKLQTAQIVHKIYNLIPLKMFGTNKSVTKKVFSNVEVED